MTQPQEFAGFDQAETFLDRTEDRLHYAKRLGYPYAHHFAPPDYTLKDQLDIALEDLDEMTELVRAVEAKVGDLDDREQELNDAREEVDRRIEEAEAERDSVCRENETLRERIFDLEDGNALVRLEGEIERLKGQLAYTRRKLDEKCKALAEAREEMQETVAKLTHQHKLDILVWEKRFSELPLTWQERLMKESLF